MKYIIAMIVVLAVLISTLSGCSGTATIELTASEDELAEGFVWENNYSEIIITGYEGVSNDVVIPSRINGKPVTAIAENAFKGFEKLKSVVIPESVKTIDSAFIDCTGLKEIELSEGLESMRYAFMGCTSIKSIQIPESVKDIGYAFRGCTALEQANIPTSAQDTRGAYDDCVSLVSVTIPKGVKTIDGAFSGCTSLKSVSLPEGLESMMSAFSGCTALENTVVPETVTSIDGAFVGCTSITELTIPEKAGENIIESISYTFNNCSSLKLLVLPDSYKGEVKFKGLYSIEQITMSDESLEATIVCDIDTSYDICKESSEEWYKRMINTNLSGVTYRYDINSIEIGEQSYIRIWSVNGSEVETYEYSEEDNGRIVLEKCCFLALTDDWNSEKCVICETTEYEYIIEVETDSDGEYLNDTVVINGDAYPFFKH